jgi:uncharacterized protein (UPF0276 family)
MLDQSFNALPDAVGVGYKPQHFSEISKSNHSVKWLEIHAENYMGAGGRPRAQLIHLAKKFPISVHGVGLSIGGEAPLDRDHLERLKTVCDWLQPASFSEHLAWSTYDGAFMNDLLPLAYTNNSLTRIVDHIDQVQSHIGHRMLLENPSSYLAFEDSTYDEPTFLREIAKRSGCGLLLDVNNVFVSAENLGFDAVSYVSELPLDKVGEIHLGGHDEDVDSYGHRVLIDSHGTAVVDPVWRLYSYVIAQTGPRPTLIEWDNNVPDWDDLHNEVIQAKKLLSRLGVSP